MRRTTVKTSYRDIACGGCLAVSRSSGQTITQAERDKIIEYLKPLEQLRELLEAKATSEDEELSQLARKCITLLNVFSTEPVQCYYIMTHMVYCDQYGLVSCSRCIDCSNYDAWFYSPVKNPEYCMFNTDILRQQR